MLFLRAWGTPPLINTYHGLVYDLCKKAGVEVMEYTKNRGKDLWRDVAPENLMQACDLLGPEHKFDALVVDEGQDFHELWWTSLDAVFRDPNAKACYYVFYDPNQNLFVDSPSIPGELGAAFELPVNCRNTVKISGHCAALVKQENKVREGAPIGDEPEFTTANNLHDAFLLAGKRVREWCMPNAGGLKRSQVAVLAPGTSEREWPKDFQTVALTQNYEAWRENKGVLLTSWGKFKGMEADAVVIVETARPDDESERVNRYVARSRAKHLLSVIQVKVA